MTTSIWKFGLEDPWFKLHFPSAAGCCMHSSACIVHLHVPTSKYKNRALHHHLLMWQQVLLVHTFVIRYHSLYIHTNDHTNVCLLLPYNLFRVSKTPKHGHPLLLCTWNSNYIDLENGTPGIHDTCDHLCCLAPWKQNVMSIWLVYLGMLRHLLNHPNTFNILSIHPRKTS